VTGAETPQGISWRCDAISIRVARDMGLQAYGDARNWRRDPSGAVFLPKNSTDFNRQIHRYAATGRGMRRKYARTLSVLGRRAGGRRSRRRPNRKPLHASRLFSVDILAGNADCEALLGHEMVGRPSQFSGSSNGFFWGRRRGYCDRFLPCSRSLLYRFRFRFF